MAFRFLHTDLYFSSSFFSPLPFQFCVHGISFVEIFSVSIRFIYCSWNCSESTLWFPEENNSKHQEIKRKIDLQIYRVAKWKKIMGIASFNQYNNCRFNARVCVQVIWAKKIAIMSDRVFSFVGFQYHPTQKIVWNSGKTIARCRIQWYEIRNVRS